MPDFDLDGVLSPPYSHWQVILKAWAENTPESDCPNHWITAQLQRLKGFDLAEITWMRQESTVRVFLRYQAHYSTPVCDGVVEQHAIDNWNQRLLPMLSGAWKGNFTRCQAEVTPYA